MYSLKAFISEANLKTTDIGKRNNLQFFADKIWGKIFSIFLGENKTG